jgi:hypothetical protein
VFIESDLVLIHVDHSHTAYLKASRYHSLFEEERQRILSLSVLSEDVPRFLILRTVGDPTQGQVLEDNTHVLRVELIVLGADAITRVNPRVGLGVGVEGIEGRVPTEELPRLLGHHGEDIILDRVLHKKGDAAERFLAALTPIENQILRVLKLNQWRGFDVQRIRELLDLVSLHVVESHLVQVLSINL